MNSFGTAVVHGFVAVADVAVAPVDTVVGTVIVELVVEPAKHLCSRDLHQRNVPNRTDPRILGQMRSLVEGDYEALLVDLDAVAHTAEEWVWTRAMMDGGQEVTQGRDVL